VNATVSWNKQSLTVDINETTTAASLKEILESLTSVPADRQKIMPKTKKMWKGLLPADFAFSSLNLAEIAAANKKGIEFSMMGSVGTLAAPATKTVFIEDMTTEEAAKTGAVLPAGLVNLGNTCYMNSTLQCLRATPNLRDTLSTYTGNDSFTSTLRDTFNMLDHSAAAIPPMHFVMAMRSAYPQFAQQNQGRYSQQDADEFLTSLTTKLSTNLKDVRSAYKNEAITDEAIGGAGNAFDSLFGLKMEETLTCSDAGDAEPPKVSYDLERKVVCNIQGGHGSTINVGHLAEGIALGLTSDVEKISDVLGRNANWTKKSRIDRLPKFLCVQFMRFFWKPTPDSSDHAGVKCKILKPVTFNIDLDMYEFCSTRLQTILKVSRDEAIVIEEERAAKKLRGDDGSASTTATAGDAMDVEEEKKPAAGDDATATTDTSTAAAATTMSVEEREMQAAMEMSMSDATSSSSSQSPGVSGAGLPDKFQGKYELYAVVTHKGRDSDGGHYIAWVRQGKTDDWLIFDDDEVYPCTQDKVLALKGGGDHHMAYLNFYRAKE
jgi:ubiquitin carboxyl-terminal hydrolase 14